MVYGAGMSELYRPLWELPVNYTMLQSFVAVRDFDGVYWSLAREIVFYIIIAVALAVFRHRISDRFVVWFSLAWSLGGLGLILVNNLVGGKWLAIMTSASVGQFAPLFGLGMLFYLRSTGQKLHPSAALLAILAVVNEGLMTGWVEGLLVGVIVVGFAIVVVVRDIPVLRQGWLVWLGAISYPLYLLHQNVGYVVISRTVDVIGPWPSRILALAVALGLAWLVHELVEKRLSRAINRRLRARSAGPRRAATDAS